MTIPDRLKTYQECCYIKHYKQTYMLNLSNYTKEEIENAIQQTIGFFDKIQEIDMSRLDRQINVTRLILEDFRLGKKIAIVDAPTGFGKSILGFFIHYTLQFLFAEDSKLDSYADEEHEFGSYILTSNKFLQNQYLRDILAFNFEDMKMLKGKSNYFCNIEPSVQYSKAACSAESDSSLMKDGAKGKFTCASRCSYLRAKYEAMHASSTVFNYSYFLSTMNYVTNMLGPTAPFPVRDLTIFDECHVINNIVSDAFSLTFNPNKFIREIRAASSVIATQRNNNQLFEKYKPSTFWKSIDKSCHILVNTTNSEEIKDELTSLAENLLSIVNDFVPFISKVIQKKDDYPDEELTDYEKYILEFSTTIVSPYNAIKMQLDVYEKIGFNSSVISAKELNPEKNKYLTIDEAEFSKTIDSELQFECTDEAEMIKRYALSFTNYTILMSATIGKPSDFAKSLQLDKETFSCYEVSSDFDYTLSPIFKVQPMISMSHKNKAINMPKMMKRIIDVIDHNPGVRGLIHTGNFEIMNKLKDLRHPRILTYSNSFEKEDILKLLESKPDAIVAGPSLVEGVDLKDDLCRFMIFAKVPYLSLASKLNKRKMELYDGWYNFQTLKSFQQGLGRPVRHKTDWCKTYLLDASFESFFGRSPLPHIISDRLVETDISNLGLPLPSADDEFEAMLREMEGNG